MRVHEEILAIWRSAYRPWPASSAPKRSSQPFAFNADALGADRQLHAEATELTPPAERVICQEDGDAEEAFRKSLREITETG